MIEAEKSLLGAMLISREAVNLAVELDTADFTDRRNATIFGEMKQMHEQGIGVDTVTVMEHLSGKGILTTVGGVPYLVELVNNTPTWTNAPAYIAYIRAGRQRREFTQGMNDTVKAALAGEDYIAAAQRVIDRVVNLGTRDISPVGARALSALVKDSKQRHLKTGFRSLDYTLGGGLLPGQLVVIGGQPGMGKTTFAMNIAMHAAKRQRVLVFSLEMTMDELLERAAISESEINIYESQQNVAAADALIKAAEGISKRDLYIDDTGGVAVDYIKAKCYKVKPALVVIDNLNIMGIHVGRGETRERGIADVTCKLKALAKDLSCPIVLVVQLSRVVAARKIKKPLTSDIRDSGSIEQDADIVLFPYRPYANGESQDKNEALVIVGKNRSGMVGEIELRCDMKHFNFLDKDSTEKKPEPEPSLLDFTETQEEVPF